MAKGRMGNHHGVTSPDEKMSRLEMGEVSSNVKKVLKKRAAKKRRQRDSKVLRERDLL